MNSDSVLAHPLQQTSYQALISSFALLTALSLSLFVTSLLLTSVGVASPLNGHAGGEVSHGKTFLQTLRSDVLGFRFLYGQSSLSAQDAGPHGRHEQLFGTALALEWALFHHHLELEAIIGGFEHEGAFDEFGELVLKLPFKLSHNVDLLVGVGGILETHHQKPELGVTTDVNARYWLGAHWGLSAELDYVMLESGSRSTEGIAELLYRF